MALTWRGEGEEPLLESRWRRAEGEEEDSLLGWMPMLAKTLFTGGVVNLIAFLVFPSINRHLCKSTNRSK